MKLHKQPTEVTLTFSPKEFWLKKSDDIDKGEYMLVYRIDMSYKGKSDQEGSPKLYLEEREAETFREAGFGEISWQTAEITKPA